MSSFEQLLKDRGYVQYCLNRKGSGWEQRECLSYSSMVDLQSTWIKGDVEICYGLHEYPYPPTLVTRPRVDCSFIGFDGKLYSLSNQYRIVCDAMFEHHTNEEILDAIESNKILMVELSKEQKDNHVDDIKKRESIMMPFLNNAK